MWEEEQVCPRAQESRASVQTWVQLGPRVAQQFVFPTEFSFSLDG